jgi:preprotein translocase subunit SecE
MIAKTKKFLSEVTIELKKVAWSTRTELVGSTASVFILVIIMAVFIGFCDIVLSKIIDLVIRYSL